MRVVKFLIGRSIAIHSKGQLKLADKRLSGDPRLAVVIPCYNEEQTVGKVISDFKSSAPNAEIYVIDNNSTDATAERAEASGAHVIHEKRQGKGYAVQRMFESIEADIYVMVDGDDTYPAEDIHGLTRAIASGRADMVIGNRRASRSDMPTIRRLGNAMIASLANLLFGTRLRDPLSGYRAMSREFILNLPLVSGGFEIETELNIQAHSHGYSVAELPIGYRDRPLGSDSKLNAFQDGYRILRTLVVLMSNKRPLACFGFLATWPLAAGLALGFLSPGGEWQLPMRSGLFLLSALLIAMGIVLNALGKRLDEIQVMIRRQNLRAESDARAPNPGPSRMSEKKYPRGLRRER